MKQTAVEWIIEEINQQQKRYIDLAKKDKSLKKEVDAILTSTTLLKMKCEQAKEMEKQQIIQSHLQGSKNSIIEVSKYIKVNNTLDTIKNIEKGIDEHCDGIKYYNETFKNK